jgi:hypothetical protein
MVMLYDSQLSEIREEISMLIWNSYDFMACLEVIPETDEYETFHTYRIEHAGIRLVLTVFQYAGDVHLSVYSQGVDQPIFEMKLLGCSGARYVNDDRGEYLEFAPAKCFGNRYDGESPIPYGLQVAVRPNICVRLF